MFIFWFAESRAAPRPTVFIKGNHEDFVWLDAEIAGVRCIGLNKVAMPGNLVALDVAARGRGYEILGEWLRREQVAPRALGHQEVGEEAS